MSSTSRRRHPQGEGHRSPSPTSDSILNMSASATAPEEKNESIIGMLDMINCTRAQASDKVDDESQLRHAIYSSRCAFLSFSCSKSRNGRRFRCWENFFNGPVCGYVCTCSLEMHSMMR